MSAEQKIVTILSLLEDHGPLHGLELVVRSKGFLKRGLVYVWLDKMEDDGLITSHMEPCNRRIYAITNAGRAERAKEKQIEASPLARYGLLGL